MKVVGSNDSFERQSQLDFDCDAFISWTWDFITESFVEHLTRIVPPARENPDFYYEWFSTAL